MMRASVVSSRSLGRPDRQRAVAVDRAGKDLRAGLLLDRHALAGDRRLIDRAGARGDPAIERDALARWNDEAAAKPDFGHRHRGFRSVRPKHVRGRRREIEQRRDCAPCAPDAPAFQRQRQREKERYCGGLKPLADCHCANDRDGHQQVHVGSQIACSEPCLDHDEPCAEESRREISGNLGPGIVALAWLPRSLQAGAKPPASTT